MGVFINSGSHLNFEPRLVAVLASAMQMQNCNRTSCKPAAYPSSKVFPTFDKILVNNGFSMRELFIFFGRKHLAWKLHYLQT